MANPYESPPSAATETPAFRSQPFIRGFIRLAALAFAGFASFFAIGLLFVVVAETFELEIFPSINWALAIGALGASFFLGSEVFNSGKGQQAGFLIRFVVAIAIFIVSGFIASALVPRQPYRSEETDPYWPHRLLLFAAVLIPALSIARLLWIGDHRASD